MEGEVAGFRPIGCVLTIKTKSASTEILHHDGQVCTALVRDGSWSSYPDILHAYSTSILCLLSFGWNFLINYGKISQKCSPKEKK